MSELQLVVAPYDVRQSGFSGGGINVITRSGANRFSGTAYLYNRNEGLVGRGIDDLPIATFFDRQQGASVGGPLVRNRAFFFANVDTERRETPVGYSVDGSTGVDFGYLAEGQRIAEVARARYGYDIPGGFGELIRGNPNDKIFVRTDINLSAGQRLSVRHNYVDATADVGSQSNFRYRFADNFYLFRSRTHSTVAQLNSTFGNAVNLARVSYQRIRDRRGPQTAPFPQVTIDLEGGEDIRFGTEQFSTANALDQEIIEIHNDLTWVRGRHQFTVGTHNELFRFDNLFIRDNFGVYEFASPELFAQGLAQSYSYSFSRTADPRQAAEFWVYQLGFYAGDQWRVRDDLSLTYGIRLDAPIFPDTPSANPLVETLFGRATDVVPATRNSGRRSSASATRSAGSAALRRQRHVVEQLDADHEERGVHHLVEELVVDAGVQVAAERDAHRRQRQQHERHRQVVGRPLAEPRVGHHLRPVDHEEEADAGRLERRPVHPLRQQVGVQGRPAGVDREARESGQQTPEQPKPAVRRRAPAAVSPPPREVPRRVDQRDDRDDHA